MTRDQRRGFSQGLCHSPLCNLSSSVTFQSQPLNVVGARVLQTFECLPISWEVMLVLRFSLGWRPRFCFSNLFPADWACLGARLRVASVFQVTSEVLFSSNVLTLVLLLKKKIIFWHTENQENFYIILFLKWLINSKYMMVYMGNLTSF